MKALPLRAAADGPFTYLSKLSIEDGSYPLARQVYLYFAPDFPSGELRPPRDNPKVREFLKYVLSREGQEAVEAEGSYLPLSETAASSESKKLD